jgi:hypothetical protein
MRRIVTYPTANVGLAPAADGGRFHAPSRIQRLMQAGEAPVRAAI